MGTGCAFTDIQSAINAAGSGDELRLLNETFADAINVDISLTIKGGYASCGASSQQTISNTIIEGDSVVDSAIEIVNGARGSAPITVLIDHVQITGGTDDGTGGGIEVGSGSIIRLSRTFITGNDGALGGGIYLDEFATLEQIGTITIQNNTAEQGAGIYASTGAQLILQSSSNIRNNTADFEGGGIFLSPGAALISNENSSDLEIQNNESGVATGFAGGGGIYVSAGATINVDEGRVFENNAPQRGGGVYVEGAGITPTVANVVFRSIDFEFNRAGFGGGAIYFDANGGHHAEISYVTVNQNIAETASGSSIWDSGGIRIDGAGDFSLTVVSFNLNSGRNGAGMFISGGAEVQCNGCQILNNVATSNGGGVMVDNATFSATYNTPSTTTFRNNTANGFGGGLALVNGATFVTTPSANAGFFATEFFDNHTTSGNGGGIYADQSTVNLDRTRIGSQIRPNISVGVGGGIFVKNSDLTLFESHVNFNQAINGGGIYASDSNLSFDADPIFPDASPSRGPQACDVAMLIPGLYCSEIRGNDASGVGGGLVFSNAMATTTALLEQIYIGENQADDGAAIYLNQSQLSLESSLIAGNLTGAAITLFNASAVLESTNVTLVDNEGAAFRTKGSNRTEKTERHRGASPTLALDRTLSWGNGADLIEDLAATILGSCNFSETSAFPDEVTATHPGFSATPRGPYRLASNSSLLDACQTGLGVGLDGVDRPTGMGIDIGAFEGGWEYIFIDGFGG